MSIQTIKIKNGNIKYKATKACAVAGKSGRVSKTFSCRKAAKQWESEIRFKRDTKSFSLQCAITVDMLFEKFIEDCVAKQNSETYVMRARGMFENFLKPFYGQFDMKNISIEHHKKLFIQSL